LVGAKKTTTYSRGGRTLDEIALAEGWAFHKIFPDYMDDRGPEDMLHFAIGVFSLKESIYRYRFSSNIDVRVEGDGPLTRVEYHTPHGVASTTIRYDDEMRKNGASFPWTEEHIIKRREDYRVVGDIFENLELIPDFDDFIAWREAVGGNGFVATTPTTESASPIHHIQKYLLPPTDFYYHYRDYEKEMRDLAEIVEESYIKPALTIAADSPAELIFWGSNFDYTITYPPYFEKEILPWIQKAVDVLEDKGKYMTCHCDGENFGLVDLIKASGTHMAESVCPYPGTRLKIEELYALWCDTLTLFGGIPEDMLLAEVTSDEEFEAYLDHLFRAVVPGTRLILGVADAVPPKAVFDRLVRIGERVEKEGRLPLEGGAFRPVSEDQIIAAEARKRPLEAKDETIKRIQDDVAQGAHEAIQGHIEEALHKGLIAEDILHTGMLPVMEEFGEAFKAGTVFIPEVLLAARAMNEGLVVLEPHLAQTGSREQGKVLLGTVFGDFHDIGKNLVVMMLRGVGFEIRDMGTNVPVEEFVRQVSEYKPDILGMSALLSTTMGQMDTVIQALESRGLRQGTKVVIGGAAVSQNYANTIGADGYARDAGEAITLFRELIKP
jgi:5-methyltetrahydrofolate--homocysteine methyltransferase